MIKLEAQVTTTVTIKLSESEARALQAIAGYGVDNFVNEFYKTMGEHYLKPHVEGLKTLLKGVNDVIVPALSEVDRARTFLKTNLET